MTLLPRPGLLLAVAALTLGSTPCFAEPGPGVDVRQSLAEQPRREMIPGMLATAPGAEFATDDYYFVITFDTRAKGVEIDSKLRTGYPREMTIILQHDFRVVRTADGSFTVLLHFDGVEKALTIPYEAVTDFQIPPFGLHLVWDEGRLDDEGAPKARPAPPSPPRPIG